MFICTFAIVESLAMLYKNSKAMQESLCFPVSFNIFSLAVPDILLTHTTHLLTYLYNTSLNRMYPFFVRIRACQWHATIFKLKFLTVRFLAFILSWLFVGSKNLW